MTTRVIASITDLSGLVRLLNGRKLPFTATIVQGKKRTDDQNRLQRMWCNEAAEQLGDETAEEKRGYIKLHYGVPILRNENEEFCEKYDRIIRPLPYETKLELMMVPFDFPVTRIMTTKQKSIYLDQVYRFFRGAGVDLTEPGG